MHVSVMTARLYVGGAVLFCGPTHPEATAAARQIACGPVSDETDEMSRGSRAVVKARSLIQSPWSRCFGVLVNLCMFP